MKFTVTFQNELLTINNLPFYTKNEMTFKKNPNLAVLATVLLSNANLCLAFRLTGIKNGVLHFEMELILLQFLPLVRSTVP